jgi:hypothetical protein
MVATQASDGFPDRGQVRTSKPSSQRDAESAGEVGRPWNLPEGQVPRYLHVIEALGDLACGYGYTDEAAKEIVEGILADIQRYFN